MDAEEARSSFLEMYARFADSREAISKIQNGLQTRYTEARHELATSLMGKKKRSITTALSNLDQEAWPIYLLKRRFLDEWDHGGLLLEREHRWMKYQLVQLADAAFVHRGELRVELSRVYLSAYNSQGFGAQKYTRRAAELDAANVAPYCSAEVVEDVSPGLNGKPRLQAYVVIVLVEYELDAEIARRKPPMELRDWLKWCWKNSVNPRVYNPFLPHGLEEKLGINYHGDDIKETA